MVRADHRNDLATIASCESATLTTGMVGLSYKDHRVVYEIEVATTHDVSKAMAIH